MESPCEEMEKMGEEQNPLLLMANNPSASTKGGFRTLPFIVGTMAFVSMTTRALAADMIKYLMGEYHMSLVSASNLIYFWYAITYIVPITGAILGDSLMGRFQVIGIASIIGLVGMILLWLPTMIPHAKPPPCIEDNCNSATTFQLIRLCISFVLLSLGTGGVVSCLLAFGSDQLKNIKHNVGAIMESYFSWYYAIFALCEVVGLTCLVYIQENMGWQIGYGVLVVFLLFASLSFFLGSPFYVKVNAKRSLIPGLLKVVVASCRNRHLILSSSGNAEIGYHHKSSILDHPSGKLRFLNKACMIQNPQQDLNSDGTAANPWRLCTVEQVEELKAILKVIPIWLTGLIMSINFCQSSFLVLQATTLDRHIGSSFEIPAGSVNLFGVGFSIIWIVLYDRVLLPLASRIRGNNVHFGTKSRMGFGIFVSFWYTAVVAIVEAIRRHRLATKEEYCYDLNGIATDIHVLNRHIKCTDNMSILWVLPQYALMGIAVGSNAVAQNQFFISEFPRSMSSIASSLYALGYSLASVLASFLMSSVDELTRRSGNHQSWVSSNINEGHYDYFYCVLAGLTMVNFVLFLVCSRAYGPYCQLEKTEDVEEEEQGWKNRSTR